MEKRLNFIAIAEDTKKLQGEAAKLRNYTKRKSVKSAATLTEKLRELYSNLLALLSGDIPLSYVEEENPPKEEAAPKGRGDAISALVREEENENEEEERSPEEGQEEAPESPVGSLGESLAELGLEEFENASDVMSLMITLASYLGLEAEERGIVNTIMRLPRSEKTDLNLLTAAKVLVGDLCFCYDFTGAVLLFKEISSRADEASSLLSFLNMGAFLADKLGEKGSLDVAKEIYAIMREVYDKRPLSSEKEVYFEAMNSALYSLVVHFLALEKLDEAFSRYEDMQEFKGSDAGFALMAKAGFRLFLPFSRGADDKNRKKLLKSLAPKDEDPDTTVIKASVALMVARDEAMSGRSDGARSIFEVMESLPNQNYIHLDVIRAAGSIIDLFLSISMEDEALALFNHVSIRVSEGIAYAAMVDPAIQLILNFYENGRLEEAKEIFINSWDLSSREDDLVRFAKAFAELIHLRVDIGFAEEAYELLEIFQNDHDSDEVLKVELGMIYEVVKSLAKHGYTSEAEQLMSSVVTNDLSPEIKNARIMAELCLFNAFLLANENQMAFAFWKRNAVLEGSDVISYRWTKAAERLIESLVDKKDCVRARRVYDIVRKKLPGDEKFILKLYTMALEIILGYCAKGYHLAAQTLFESLPDPGESVKLEAEKAELAFLLMTDLFKKGMVVNSINFYQSLIPEEANTRRTPGLARLASWLVRNLCSRGSLDQAFEVYESLATLKPQAEIARQRAKAALRLIHLAVKLERAEEALVLFKSIPLFYDPKKIQAKLSEAAKELTLLLTRKNELEKAQEIKRYIIR
jgi:tetratricopeptide (TPR) repeat protein